MTHPSHHDAHTHHHTQNEKTLLVSFVIIFLFMMVEAIGGWLSGSLALLADAGHMLTDALALAMSALAFVVSRKPPDKEHSYGHKRYQVVAAFLNGVFLISIVVWITLEAFERFQNPREIDLRIMLPIATVGLFVNILVFYILSSGEKNNLNIRGAMLHVLGDLLGSVAAIIAGVMVYFYQWLWIDPLLSLVVAALIIKSGIRLVMDSLHILLEGVPVHVDIHKIKRSILNEVNGAIDVHHFHVWSITEQDVLMTFHLKVEEQANNDRVLREANRVLKEKYHIYHATIQIEHAFCSSESTALQSSHVKKEPLI